MTMVRMPDMETFVQDLQRSLKYYGKVYQIKKYTIDGFFEGHVSFMIDTTVKYKDAEGHDYEVQPLSRMLYLSAWDVYVPVTYRGAPPVCHFCRQSGHIRAACPVLAKRQCFKCRKMGHTVRFCREEETTFEEALEGYETSKQANEEPRLANLPRRSNDGNKKQRRGSKPLLQDALAHCNADVAADKPVQQQKSNTHQRRRSEADKMDVDPKNLLRTNQGSNASKHAPLALSLHMHVDPPGSAATNSDDVNTDVPPLRRHSMSSTSMSQTPTYHAAHRA